MSVLGFDNKLYVEKQSQKIKERIKKLGGRLYLEFGGKLFDDLHASRVLPGFEAETKIKMLSELKDIAEVFVVISAADIKRNKIRGDIGITYGSELMRMIDNIRAYGLLVSNIVITQYEDDAVVNKYIKHLEQQGEKVYTHHSINDYPNDIETIVSKDGYGSNSYIPASRQLVVVTAPGPGSGKLATCLNQLYHEKIKGIEAAYAKFETFPIWNIPLNHPINVAYEAATADLNDVNVLDGYHYDAYGEYAVSYNRDADAFPVVKAILHKIKGKDLYNSPTDMGVNMVGYAITNDKVCSDAAIQEIIRRYYRACVDYKIGNGTKEAVNRLQLLFNKADISVNDRKVVAPAIERGQQVNSPVVAIELNDGKIVTGKESKLLTASSSALLNALKYLTDIDDSIQLISPTVIEPILKLNKHIIKTKKDMMTLEETLVALSITAATCSNSLKAFDALTQLRNCQAHSTYIMSTVDMNILRRLGIMLTCEPRYESEDLFVD